MSAVPPGMVTATVMSLLIAGTPEMVKAPSAFFVAAWPLYDMPVRNCLPCSVGVTTTEYAPSEYATVAVASMKFAAVDSAPVLTLINFTGSSYALPSTSLKPSAVVTVFSTGSGVGSATSSLVLKSSIALFSCAVTPSTPACGILSLAAAFSAVSIAVCNVFQASSDFSPCSRAFAVAMAAFSLLLSTFCSSWLGLLVSPEYVPPSSTNWKSWTFVLFMAVIVYENVKSYVPSTEGSGSVYVTEPSSLVTLSTALPS